jgi:hypothetical protein
MSTPTSITFSGFSLQNDTYRVENIEHRHLANKIIDRKDKPRRGGFDIVDTFYNQKEIAISGWILADTKENLRIAVDNLKRNLNPQEENLDINYGDDIIRYKATVSNMTVQEAHYHITRIPFNITFLTLPWGTESNSLDDSKTITTSTYTNSINVGGSYGPFPILRWTVSGTPTTEVSKIKFENKETNDFIEVPGLSLSSSGSYLEIDIENMTVMEGGTTNKDFEGVFPFFISSTNSYETTVSGSGFTLVQKITYFPTYL